MSFIKYLKEMTIDFDYPSTEEVLNDYEGKPIDLVTVGNIIVHDKDMVDKMRHENISMIEDYLDKTQKYYKFVLRHLKELKKIKNFTMEKDEFDKLKELAGER